MWRAIRNLLLLACVSVAAGLRVSSAAESSFAKDYGDSKQAISSREAGQLLLKLVNDERGKHGLSQLQLSAPASKLAKQHADDMAEHGYVGHYDLEGRKCELRYNLLGETDHVAENLAMREVGARVRLTPELVRSIFADWMGSKSHRMNIHDPAHTHMGYGFATRTSGEITKVYAVQEFVNNWGEFPPLTTSVKAGSAITVKGNLQPTALLWSIELAWEAPPGSRTPASVGDDDLHYAQPKSKIVYMSPLMGKMLGGMLIPDAGRTFYANQISMGSDGSVGLNLLVPNLTKPADLYVTTWMVLDRTGQGIVDGFGDPDRSEPPKDYVFDGPGKWDPFRAMTQVVRVNPE